MPMRYTHRPSHLPLPILHRFSYPSQLIIVHLDAVCFPESLLDLGLDRPLGIPKAKVVR